jgi:hypothetical protein
VQWALAGFPSNHVIHQLTISVPPVCSDGKTRELQEYIEFCSGKPFHKHIEVLQGRLAADMQLGFCRTVDAIQIVISRVVAIGPTGTVVVEETGPTGTVEETGPTGTVEETGPTGTTGE